MEMFCIRKDETRKDSGRLNGQDGNEEYTEYPAQLKDYL